MHLTKSRYLAGLQCLRRLWLGVNQPPEWVEPAPGSSQDIGAEIGFKAHLLFPGGILVEEAPWQHEEAVARTRALMADPSVPAIFEAAFEQDGIRVRIESLCALRVEEVREDAFDILHDKSQAGRRTIPIHSKLKPIMARLLENAGVPENVAADIAGHDKPTMTYGLYSGGASLEVKRDALERSGYPP